MSQGQCLLWPVDSLNRTSIDGIEDSDYGPWETSNKGKDRHSQCTMNLLMFGWKFQLGTHVCLFMSATSFASLVIVWVPHIKKIARQLNRVLIGAIFCPLSLLQVIFGITHTCYHDAQMPLHTLIVLLNDRYWMSFLIFLIFVKSLILFGPAFIVFSQSRGKTIKPGFQKRKILWSARTHLEDLAGSGL